ncbi:hypothetical protein N7541_001128 [Penicillium brevicompactum]|uniref:Uncharacterized protein n=1 Tax=Penicillium brevicompactum TaxID=5074 RepID=A0A9W9RVQ0_PENBR|nr:hypothetical protein N7541_001128 [Penicillium brevicompactum]
MSKALKELGEQLFMSKLYTKLFQTQTAGKRIAPPQANDNKTKAQLRLDAGEVIGDWKNVYLQVNSQAQNEALAKFRKKNGTDAKLASGKINVNTPEKEQEEAAQALWNALASDAKKKLG